MRWTTWLALAGILLPASLAGCIRPAPEGYDQPAQPQACDDCGSFPVFCADCGSAPPPSTSAPPCHVDHERMRHDPFYDPCALPCACPPCPPNALCEACACSAAPPLLDVFETRPLGACPSCASPAVGAARTGPAIYVATEEGLHVVGPEDARQIPHPEPPIPSPLPWTYGSPSIHVDAADRVWVATLATSGAIRVLMVSKWIPGEDDLGNYVAVDLSHLPLLALAGRAWISEVDGAPVAIVATDGAAWALRSYDDGATFASPEPLAPPGGEATFGAPTLDAKRRLLVPFAWAPATLVPSPYPAPSYRTLHFAALADVHGAWSQHAGVGSPAGIEATSRPSLAVSERVARFVYVDASGTLARMESHDRGGSWGSGADWSEPREEANGTPATATGSIGPTVAWWTDEGALRVARQRDDSGELARATVAQVEGAEAKEATLALRANGRAVVAWLDSGDLWLGVEQGEEIATMPACDDSAHCAHAG